MRIRSSSLAARVTAPLTAAAVGALLIGPAASPAAAQQTTITGAGSAAGVGSGFGGVIGLGATLAVTQGTVQGVAVPGANALTFTLARGAGSLNDFGVIYIDTGLTSPTTSFADTTQFNDANDPTRAAISARGSSAAGRADLTFATGFRASHAVGFSQGFGGLWSLSAGGNNSLGFVRSVDFTPTNNPSAASFTFGFNLSDIGLTAGQSFKFFGTYLNPNDGGGAFRSNEFIGVSAATAGNSNIGINSRTLGANDFNIFQSNAVPSNAPEPGSLALLAPAALGALGVVRRRRVAAAR